MIPSGQDIKKNGAQIVIFIVVIAALGWFLIFREVITGWESYLSIVGSTASFVGVLFIGLQMKTAGEKINRLSSAIDETKEEIRSRVLLAILPQVVHRIAGLITFLERSEFKEAKIYLVLIRDDLTQLLTFDSVWKKPEKKIIKDYIENIDILRGELRNIEKMKFDENSINDAIKLSENLRNFLKEKLQKFTSI